MHNESFKVQLDKLLLRLRKSGDDCQAAIRRVVLNKPQPAPKSASKKLIDATFELESLVPRIQEVFSRLGKRATSGKKNLRGFKYVRGLKRRGVVPVIENVCMKIGALWGFESVLVGWTYALGQSMTFIQGVGYGAVFGFCNIVLGLGIGHALRYGCLRYHDTYSVAKLKAVAWSVVVVFSVMLVWLVFTASRIRSLGRNTDLFNFEELGLLATYADGYTVLFLALAVISTSVAIYEASTQASDFEVGFTAIQKEADDIDERGEKMAEQLRFTVEDIFDNAIDDFEAAHPHPDDIADHHDDIEDALDMVQRHNSEVAIVSREIYEIRKARFEVERGKPPMPINLSELTIDIESVQEKLTFNDTQGASEDLIAKLETAKQMALTTITDALMDYLDDASQPIDEDQED